ncbi:hypothetical protein NVP1248O_75 [Vibrio phage 1.248.O._10N.261.54.F1]|nr:hypothetical protein NVP1248O_75 [Vibrio phage 1.248.O._10N.261.54.F1]
MYKLAKFRKHLKENVSEARYKRTAEAIRNFKSCFYVRDCFHESGFINRAVRIKWSMYHDLRRVVERNENPLFWQLTKEGMKYGQ